MSIVDLGAEKEFKYRAYNDMNAIDYAKTAGETIMNKYNAADLPPARSFHYHQGVFLSGMEQTYLNTKDRKLYGKTNCRK